MYSQRELEKINSTLKLNECIQTMSGVLASSIISKHKYSLVQGDSILKQILRLR